MKITLQEVIQEAVRKVITLGPDDEQQLVDSLTDRAVAVSEAIQRQRTRIFRAMAFVKVTRESFKEDEDQGDVLDATHELLDYIALKLDCISMDGTDGDESPGEQS
jgi:hypothetical protein